MQLDIVMLPVNSIIPYWRNPRRNDKTVDALVEVIEKHGFDVPIVVDKNNVVVKGHARLRAAKRLGMTEVPCVISDAPDDVIKADRVADNKIQELSMWDFGKLNMELDRIGDKMTFGKLFRPEDGLSHKDMEIPEAPQFKPAGLDFGGFEDDSEEFDSARPVPVGESTGGYVPPAPAGEAVVAQAPVGEKEAPPEKKKLKTLCPYCGKVVILDV